MSTSQDVAPADVNQLPGRSRGPLTTRARGAGLLVVNLTVVLTSWELWVRWRDISKLILPPPSEIVRALQRGFSRGLFWPHLWFTFQEAFFGFLVAMAVALPLGFLVVHFRLVDRLTMPYIVGLQSMPKIAIGPLFVTWFGFGLQSKIYLAALVAFFPIFINTVAGFRSVPNEMNELMKALGAARRHRTRLVLLPNAAPYVFAGLSVGVVFALLGAIAAEFVGSPRGMGILILTSSAAFDIAGVFAALILLSLMGITMYGVVEIVRRRIVFWQ
jgi:NitT/TauT family transport system permease protein